MYSISDLNKRKLNIVCMVPDEELFDRLRRFCPRMEKRYYSDCDCYLTSREGRGNYFSYCNGNGVNGSQYKLINVWDIDGFSDIQEVFEYENGVPMLWEDELCEV